jgi:dienelactone hydrolase
MAEATERLVATTVHGRYLLRAGAPERLLIGFHGYAESAETHLGELLRIPRSEEWTVVAVQALHPFYNRAQEVVANWMTRQNREEAIADNLAYVRKVVSDFPAPSRLVFAGFSQGVAMAWRAAASVRCDAVIALGGDIPPEIVAQRDVQLPSAALLGRGTEDGWYTAEKLEQDLRFLQPRLRAESCIFDGGHAWSDEFRRRAGELL